jgi:hypothetical protein
VRSRQGIAILFVRGGILLHDDAKSTGKKPVCGKFQRRNERRRWRAGISVEGFLRLHMEGVCRNVPRGTLPKREIVQLEKIQSNASEYDFWEQSKMWKIRTLNDEGCRHPPSTAGGVGHRDGLEA